MKKTKGNTKMWLSVALTNAIILYAASLFFPENVVLGNDLLSPISAVLMSTLVLTVIQMLVEPVVKVSKVKIKNKTLWFLILAAVNIVAVWILARLALYLGFGISSYITAIVLGVVLTLSGFFAWKMTRGEKRRKD